jgi:hypothetical protein
MPRRDRRFLTGTTYPATETERGTPWSGGTSWPSGIVATQCCRHSAGACDRSEASVFAADQPYRRPDLAMGLDRQPTGCGGGRESCPFRCQKQTRSVSINRELSRNQLSLNNLALYTLPCRYPIKTERCCDHATLLKPIIAPSGATTQPVSGFRYPRFPTIHGCYEAAEPGASNGEWPIECCRQPIRHREMVPPG